MNNILKQISKLFYLTLDQDLLKYVQQLYIKICLKKIIIQHANYH